MDFRELWRADGRIIARLRREKGWSRVRLAQAAGVSHHTVTKIERGGSVFPATLCYIAAALGVNAVALRFETERVATIGPARRGLLDASLDRYALYKDIVRQETAVRCSGIEMLRREFPKGIAKTARWSYAATKAVSFLGEFQGGEGAVRYFETMFSAAVPAGLRVEEARLFGPRGVVSRGVEFATIAGLGPVSTTWLHLAEYDRHRRLVRCHAAVNIVPVESLPVI